MAERRKVVIIGAGAVGVTFAYALQISGDADEIVLVDLDRKRAEGEVMDLSHGLPFTPPVEIRAGDYDECSDAQIVVITAGAKQKPGQTRLELVQTNVAICSEIVTQVVKRNSSAVVLVVSNPVDVLTYVALKVSGLPKSQVIGSGTVLDTARFKYLLSRHCRVDSRNVHAYILGEHGDSEVAAWSLTHIAGIQMDDCCRVCPRHCGQVERAGIVEQVRNSAYHIIDAKGFTNYAVGLAMVRIVQAVLRNESSVLTVSTLLDGEFGVSDVCLGVPTVLNVRGADMIFDAPLPEDENKALQASADCIRRIIRDVGF